MVNIPSVQAPSVIPYIGGSLFDSSSADPPAPYHFKTFQLPKGDPDPYAQYAIGWELKLDDLRGGFLQVGDFARGANQYDGDYRMTASSSLDSRYRRHLLLPPLSSQTVIGATGSSWPVFHTNIFGSLAMGTGNTANMALFKETSTSDPTPVAITYNPGAIISSLTNVVIGGISSAERLAVGKHNAATQILSDLTTGGPTSAGTMHASTAGTWGILTSPLNATTPGTSTLLIYATTSLYTLASSAAIGDAPTAALTNIPGGGCALGVEQLPKNMPLRAFWWWPRASQTSPQYGSILGTPVPGRVVHTSLEGLDPQDVPIRGLTTIYFACLWRRMVVASDGVRVMTYDGETSRDLHWQNNRTANSDYKRRVLNFIVTDNDLYVVSLNTDGSTNANTTSQDVRVEMYLPEFDAWLNVSASQALGGIAVSLDSDTAYGLGVGIMPSYAPSAPFSKQNAFAHLKMYPTGINDYWNHLFLAPSGTNPFYLYRQTGSSANNAQSYESSGTWTSPYYELPYMEGLLKRADQVVFMGDADAGGAAATVGVTLNGGNPINFAAGLDGGARTAQTALTGDNGFFYQLQVAITLTRDTTATKTPNGLPVVIRGRTYLIDPATIVGGLGGGVGL